MKLAVNKTLSWLSLLLIGVVVVGCSVKEDESRCITDLTVKFTFHKKGEEMLGREVSSISLFVFDEDGLFVGRWSEWDSNKIVDGFEMHVPLSPAKYSFVAWGGLDRDNRDYYVAHLDEKEYSVATEPVVGSSTIDNLVVRLKPEEGRSVGVQNVIDKEFDYNFFGALSDVSVGVNSLYGEHRTIEIDLIKNSTEIELTIAGLNEPTTRVATLAPVEMIFTSANGGYEFNNSLERESKIVNYIPQNREVDSEGRLHTAIHTLKLIHDNGHRFIVRDKDSKSIYFEADLLEDYIRKVPQYSNQAAIYAEDLFKIDIEVESNMAVEVSVNGWKVISNGVDIQ